MRCSNVHYLQKDINNYSKSTKLIPHTSATNFLELDIIRPSFVTNDMCQDRIKLYSELTDLKTVNFYVFERKEEAYYKNREEKKYQLLYMTC